MKKSFWLLIGILLLSAFLRIYGLGNADVITDEVLIGFRSIAYIDFFVSPYQTTPFEWFSDIPAWARLSFHDHPPLIFLIQHLSFKVIGQNIIALRLPFVLAGIGSVFLLYLIGKKLFNKNTGLIASLLLAISSYHVWISRIGLQESIVILLSLLTFYLFLKALDSGQHWQWGIALGLAMLTKYIAIILLPIFIIYLIFFKRTEFKSKQFWLAIILVIIVFSPVIIYNFKLYQARGHFDLQFSYLFGQEVEEWKVLPGKIQAGDFFDRLQNLIPAIYQGLLWPMFTFFIISLVYVGSRFRKEINKPIFLLILAIFFYLLLFLVIGPSKRFVSTLVPLLVLLISWFIYNQKKLIKISLIIILVILEIFFTVNTLLANYPIGKEGLTYSYLKTESYSWGYNQLNTYLVQLLKDKKPEVTFTARYQFLEEIKNKSLKQELELASFLLIYDNNMYDLATLWIFHRQMIYQGWPVITVNDYLSQGKDFWQLQGIKDFYFFKALDNEMLLRPIKEQTLTAETLVDQLPDIKPDIIKRPDGREVFAAYHWQ